MSEPAAHADRLTTWQLEGEKGPRPESELPAIRLAIRERQEEIEGLDRAVTRELNELVAYWNKHRPRLIKDAELHCDDKQRAYLEKIAEAAQARAELCAAKRACVLAHTYPSQEAMQEVPDTLAGGRRQPLQAMGPTRPSLRAESSTHCAPTPSGSPPRRHRSKAAHGPGPRPAQATRHRMGRRPGQQQAREKQMAQWATRR